MRVCVWFIWFAWALHSFDFVYDSYNWLATSTNLMMFTLRKKSIQRGSLIATSDYPRADILKREDTLHQGCREQARIDMPWGNLTRQCRCFITSTT